MGMMEGLTLLLAVATFWLAWATREMARSTKQLADLESQPFVAVKDVILRPGMPTTVGVPTPFINVELKLANPGKVLVKYRMASLDVTVAGQTVPPTSSFTNRGGAIHPGTETTYFYPSIPLTQQAQSPILGQLILDLRYWCVLGEEHSMRATIDLHIYLSPDFNYRWIYASGPLFS